MLSNSQIPVIESLKNFWVQKKFSYSPWVTSGCLLSRKSWWVVQIGSFGQNLRWFTDQNAPKRDHMKINFECFQIKKWMLQTVRVEKAYGKHGVIFLACMFPSRVMVLKLSIKVHFLQFCTDLSKKFKSIKVIYIYAPERCCYALSGNGIVYYDMRYCFGDIRIWS